MASLQKAVVTLKGDDEDAVEAMLRWLYTFDYEERKRNEKPANTLNFHLNTCVVADEYLVLTLKDEAVKRLQLKLESVTEDELVDFIEKISEFGGGLPGCHN